MICMTALHCRPVKHSKLVKRRQLALRHWLSLPCLPGQQGAIGCFPSGLPKKGLHHRYCLLSNERFWPTLNDFGRGLPKRRVWRFFVYRAKTAVTFQRRLKCRVTSSITRVSDLTPERETVACLDASRRGATDRLTPRHGDVRDRN
jgi:hypothetical protein